MLWTRMMAGTILVATLSACAMLGMTPEAKYLGTWEMKTDDEIIVFRFLKNGRLFVQESYGSGEIWSWEIAGQDEVVISNPEDEDMSGKVYLDNRDTLIFIDEDQDAYLFRKMDD